MSIHNKMRASTTGSATSSGSGDGENAAAAAAAGTVAADEASGAAKAPPGTTAPELPVVEAAAQQPAAVVVTAARPRPSRVHLRFHQELSPGSEGRVLSGTCDGVACVIKLLGPDGSGLAAYWREVRAYAALEPQQGSLVPELLAWGHLSWGVHSSLQHG